MLGDGNSNSPSRTSGGTCSQNSNGGTYYLYNCQNNYHAYINAWPIYAHGGNQKCGNTNCTDYFVIQLGANLSTQGCWDFYGNRSHSSRIAAYWARHYEFTASPLGPNGNPWGFDDLSILPAPYYSPQSGNPGDTVQTGLSWSIGGSGTAGQGQNTFGFSGGATFDYSNSLTLYAMEATSDIGSDPNTARWDYDSWNYVHNVIEPTNHACGGPGLQSQNLSGEIAGASFSPSMTYVWQASQNVRAAQSAQGLPVNFDLGVLLGWTYYGAEGLYSNYQCSYLGNDVYDLAYPLPSTPLTNPEANPQGLQSLYFDVSCMTTTAYGTVPLGPADASQQNNAIGNPGPMYQLPMPMGYVPFAPTSAPPLQASVAKAAR